MPQQHDVECPSGLIVSIREFRVSDEDLLADTKNQRKGLAVTALLEQITVGVSDPGPYTLKQKGDETVLDWGEVLQGDRMVILLQNRIATWGEEMEFKTPCDSCRSPIVNIIDLTDLVTKPLPDTSRPHVLAPNAEDRPIACKLPSGAVVNFRLLRGKDERALQRLQKQSKRNLSSAYLRFRTVSAEGVESTELTEWLRNMGGRDSAYLRAQFDVADCGVDQEIEFECESCGHLFNEDVKFGSDFLFPTYRVKA